MEKETDKALQLRSYLAPKYWLLWLAIGLLRLVSFLPVSVIHFLGKALGILLYRIVPSRRRAARINLKQAFPDLSDRAIDDFNKQSFKSLGISVFETGIAWFKNTSTLRQQCTIEGKEHLDRAMAKNKGVILLTGHFTTLEMGGRLIGTYVDRYNAVFKKAHDPLFNAIMVRYRSKMGDELIETRNVRAIVRGLKSGHATWFGPDQDFANQEIVFTPFLGGIASTLTATAKLAKMTGAEVVPFYPVRLENGKGYKLIILPPLEDFPSGDIEADSARVNRVIEDMVYSCPEQYLWSHKRFKTQPDRRTDIYGGAKRMTLSLLAYRLLLIILSPVLLGHITWLSIRNREPRYFRQRLGFHCPDLPSGSLWFHCASVGEVNTLLPLLKNLHAKNAGLKFIVTTNTITGGNIVNRQDLDYLVHCYLPFDWSNCIRRFLSTVKPASLYVMETEIWPNLFFVCQQHKIPVRLINARLSGKTTTANRWIKSLLKSSLATVDAIYARSDSDADAYKKLGARGRIISTVGNLKFTTAISSNHPAGKGSFSINRDYVLLASTHQDEEKQFYDIWKQLDRDELLVIAPRHPERRSSIISQLACKDIAVRSSGDEITGQTEIFLLDTVGELRGLFEQAKLVIMGGSFVPVGGHNILEPAAFNRAIITGPRMENFKEELDLMLDKKAIVQIASFDKLPKQLTKLLDDDNYRTLLENNTKKLSHNVEIILEQYTSLILPDRS